VSDVGFAVIDMHNIRGRLDWRSAAQLRWFRDREFKEHAGDVLRMTKYIRQCWSHPRQVLLRATRSQDLRHDWKYLLNVVTAPSNKQRLFYDEYVPNDN